ncbi:membrane protein insertion efficiency factor YidD [Candidatus Peregrinibacteria bacterium]|jgi:hypothetical protein|nr:membrane protein insertion efficiency factor YidD [Candidatus Peregrinibacteria bacterium]MBT3598603.1 membrane protein insertion efficiency factor YidD [Candidatus Peregrinibacteria bacterium]MBT4367018.1 membrane protein insertion efficiency factor YidD [Candidatus Peregrinibacteria bacterium]MBT4586123.1 membrane protein insertion efficiency factor YidD [Candidatus Peregrinibacteria bacterium]MBT6730598.1 membrane protein insertion efficiency factor YidD [Candidatus Peregrinibacteria bact
MRNILFFPRQILIVFIRLYQNTLSPDHGPLKAIYPYGYCRHLPTCSQYAINEIRKKGVIVGTVKAFWRILHCSPWHTPSDKKIISILSDEYLTMPNMKEDIKNCDQEIDL